MKHNLDIFKTKSVNRVLIFIGNHCNEMIFVITKFNDTDGSYAGIYIYVCITISFVVISMFLKCSFCLQAYILFGLNPLICLRMRAMEIPTSVVCHFQHFYLSTYV